MSSLVIVESPTKARTLSRFLGGDYRIEATMGHVRDLPKSKLGIDINIKNQKSKIKNEEQETYEFIPQYQVIKDRKTRVAELKKLAQEHASVLLATDPDREGEAIAWHIATLLKGSESRKGRKENSTSTTSSTPSTFRRIVFHEITQTAIQDALSHPREIDEKLVDAQQARRVLDRLVGYKLSPLLWNKLGKNWLSAGRVQSVAVRLIVEREREIKAFVPVEYWLIDADLAPSGIHHAQGRALSSEKGSFIARLIEIDGKKADVKDKAVADAIVSELEKASYQVVSVETKDVRRFPVPPFTTSTLQQAASNRFGWSAKKTMRAAQSLYEQGLITYHRTDSTNLAAEAIKGVRDHIYTVYGQSYLPPQPKFYKTKSKVAQEAHEAIRPTKSTTLADSDLKKLGEGKQSTHQLKSLPADLGRDEQLLYSLIWRRFVACQMNEAIFAATRVDVKASRILSGKDTSDGGEAATSTPPRCRNRESGYLLRANGQQVKFDGWLVLYEDNKNQKSRPKADQPLAENIKNGEEKEDTDPQNELPALTENDLLKLIKLLPQHKFTEPPPRYNEASLIKALEEKGIGRPSTYAPIITTIQDRKYVEKIQRRFHPTDLGMAVTDFLVTNFPLIFDISFTAQMENELDSIANGELTWGKVLNKFYAPFSQKLAHVFKEADRVKVDLGTTDEKCPQCGNPLAFRISRYGKFLACSNYPTCKFTKNIIEKIGIPCPKCGGDIIVRRTRRGKQFYGCSNYPKCTFAAWKKEDIK